MTADVEEVRAFHSDRLPEETRPDSAAAPRSFCGAPLCTDLDELDAQIAFLGVPSDMCAGVSGAAYGPNGIRDARLYSYSNPVTGAAGGYFDVTAERYRLEGVTIADCGDVTIIQGNIERNYWRVTRTVRRILSRGSLLVAVGGDHSVTGALVRGFDSYGEVDVVHFDAHLDFHDQTTTQGILWANGSPIRRCSEYPWVRNISQVGIRNVHHGRKEFDDARARGNRIVTADRFRQMGPEAAIALIPESEAMYVTIDVDVMDPSLCPGTGAPEAGGLNYLEMRDALRALARRGRIVGVDLVELAPKLDPTGVTAKIAGRLLIDLLSAIFDDKEK